MKAFLCVSWHKARLPVFGQQPPCWRPGAAGLREAGLRWPSERRAAGCRLARRTALTASYCSEGGMAYRTLQFLLPSSGGRLDTCRHAVFCLGFVGKMRSVVEVRLPAKAGCGSEVGKVAHVSCMYKGRALLGGHGQRCCSRMAVEKLLRRAVGRSEARPRCVPRAVPTPQAALWGAPTARASGRWVPG